MGYTLDEAKVELAKHGIHYTAKDYRDNLVTHRDYMRQFVTAESIALVESVIGRDRILASTDPYFNDIPLREWDRLAGVTPRGGDFTGKPTAPGIRLVGLSNMFTYSQHSGELAWSLADAVCILKASAHVIRGDWTHPSRPVHRDWMNVGKAAGLTGTPELDRKINGAIARMKWETAEEGKQFPMMPALGMSEVIKQCRIPKVSHVATSNELAPFGFYGIRGHYSNADVEVYVVDRGDCLTPVCCDVIEKASAEAVPA